MFYPSIRVRSISPEPFGRFSLSSAQMFLSVRRFAEPMTRLHRLKIKEAVVLLSSFSPLWEIVKLFVTLTVFCQSTIKITNIYGFTILLKVVFIQDKYLVGFQCFYNTHI